MPKTDSLDLFTRLETSVANGVFKPVYFIYGKEKYLVDQSQRLIIDRALAEHERDFNLSVVYGSDVSAQAVLATCASYPSMAQRRVVIVRDFEEISGGELFIPYVKNPNPQTVLVLVSGAGIKSNPNAAISRAAETLLFDPVSARRIPGWIKKTVENAGCKINGEAATVLHMVAGSDLYTLSNEIDKLISFVAERRVVEPSDVHHVTGNSSEFNIFELQKRVIARDFEGAERILDRMLQVSSNTAGTSIMTVTILASYFTKLMKLSGCQGDGLQQAEIAKKIGAPVYYVKEYQSALRSVGGRGIERANQALLASDYELKGGSARGEWLILTMLLRRLTGGDKRNIGRAAA